MSHIFIASLRKIFPARKKRLVRLDAPPHTHKNPRQSYTER